MQPKTQCLILGPPTDIQPLTSLKLSRESRDVDTTIAITRADRGRPPRKLLYDVVRLDPNLYRATADTLPLVPARKRDRSRSQLKSLPLSAG